MNIKWEIKNRAEIALQTLLNIKRPHKRGCLSHKKDDRDHIYEDGKEIRSNKTLGTAIKELISRFKYYFNQNPFNICVFVSAVMAFSEQCGIRWSVRWIVKVARHLKLLKGNGWSYLRAMCKIAKNIGFIPYSMMPDEINGMSWNEYSKWTEADESLLKVAERYRVKYKWIRTRNGLEDAIENGYVPCTAGKWFSDMNSPKPPNFLLRYLGYFIGGHAYRLTGWSYFAQYFEAPQTFGKGYGQDSKAWLEDPFHPRNQFAIYVFEKLPLNVLVEEFKKTYEGWVVRTKNDNKCFYIETGEKRHIPTIDSFWDIRDKIGHDKYDGLVNQETLNAIVKGNDILELNS